MNAAWKRLGCGLLVVALSGAFVGCGDDDDGDNNAAGTGASGTGTSGTGASGTGASGTSGAGTGGSAGTGGTGGRSGSGSGGSGGAGVTCGSSGVLSAECVTCVQGVVSDCGTECAALLNCRADKCAAATNESEQTACVTMCCLEEATTAVGAPGGQDALRAALTAQRAECAAMCGGTGTGDDGGI